MSDWRPIETAPRNTAILVYSHSEWAEAPEMHVAWGRGIGRWTAGTDGFSNGGAYTSVLGVTHWMPLPEPPEDV